MFAEYDATWEKLGALRRIDGDFKLKCTLLTEPDFQLLASSSCNYFCTNIPRSGFRLLDFANFTPIIVAITIFYGIDLLKFTDCVPRILVELLIADVIAVSKIYDGVSTKAIFFKTEVQIVQT